MLKKIWLSMLIFVYFVYFDNNFSVFWAEKIQIFWEKISWNKWEEKLFKIKVKNFKNIAWIQIFLKFDKNLLEFKKIVKKNFWWAENFSKWELNFLWDNFSQTKTLLDNEAILEIKFKLLWEKWETEIKISPKTKFFNSIWDEIFSNKINWKFFLQKSINSSKKDKIFKENLDKNAENDEIFSIKNIKNDKKVEKISDNFDEKYEIWQNFLGKNDKNWQKFENFFEIFKQNWLISYILNLFN